MSKVVATIFGIIIILGVGYWLYRSTVGERGLTNAELACKNSGGRVMTALCCESVGDFPNLCIVGPCGCSLENGHQVKICDCGEGKCFNGKKCVESVH